MSAYTLCVNVCGILTNRSITRHSYNENSQLHLTQSLLYPAVAQKWVQSSVATVVNYVHSEVFMTQFFTLATHGDSPFVLWCVWCFLLRNCCSCSQDGPYFLFTISRELFKIGPMFIWTFLLRITHTVISQSIADSSWITLYVLWIYVKYIQQFKVRSVFVPLSYPLTLWRWN